ncbi:MAG: HD-GYP domain-containing protein [Clostridiales bacterium]|nr:HD-GYP domain-containing protein [Clostridiales bacterium]
MEKIYLSELKSNETISRDLYNTHGAILVHKGTKMTDLLKHKLLKNDVQFFFSTRKLTPITAEYAKFFDDTTIRKAEKANKVYQESFDELANQFEFFKDNYHLNKKVITDIATQLADSISGSDQVFVGIQGIKEKDFYTYTHSLNVAVFSIIFANSMSLSTAETREIALAALLHDIGKIQMPDSILTKPFKLTVSEMNQMKNHPKIGYDILKNELSYSEEIALAALQHHEKVNKKGYPYGLSWDSLHPYSRMLAICDIYDAVTTNRVYREGMLPHQGINFLMSIVGSELDFSLTTQFVRSIAPYPLFTKVLLNTGEEGVVIRLHGNYPHRPVVRLIHHNLVRDLMSELTVFVSEVLK